MGEKLEITDIWHKRILEQVRGLAYGVVQITVHDGQIVQIDRTERSRYEVARTLRTGARRNNKEEVSKR